MAQSPARKALVQLLRSTFPGLDPYDEVEISNVYSLVNKTVKTYIKDYPFEISLAPNEKKLHLYPELLLTANDGVASTGAYLLFDPDTYYSRISGFYRLEDGDTITLGGDDEQQRAFLNIAPETPARKLSISNDDGWLRFKSHMPNPSSTIAPLLTDKKEQRVLDWRQQKLYRLKQLFGSFELLPSEEAFMQLRKVNKILEDEAYRAKDKNGKPGGVLKLPDDCAIITVGDLHGKSDNLLVVLSQNNFLEALEEGSACLVIIGDAVHPEGDAAMDDMQGSMLIMDLIFKLKLLFPKQVFYLRGNHDSFSEEISKQGVPQGLVWSKTLKKQRGKAYHREMKRFYELLPYVAYSRHFVACHAAPPVSNTSLKKLINIRSHPKLYPELMNNRMKQASRPSGYGKRDVKRLRKILELPEDAPVIVGHTPLSMDDTLWEHAGDIKHHYIIYASDSKRVGLMAQVGDKLYPFRYPVEPIISMINSLPDQTEAGIRPV